MASNTSFMLAGTAHCNQKDTWITTIADGKLNSFLVSTGDISATPVTTSLALPQSSLEDGYSNMKFSANGEKLVIPVVSENAILIYDFNNQTGLFSNPVLIHLPSKEFLMDIELSPSGSKLYYGSYEKQMEGPDFTGVELHNIFQLDLAAGSATAIENSRYQMNSFPDRGGCTYRCYIIHRTLQLGPDGKIYISLRDLGGIPLDKTVNVIEYPEKDRENAYYRRNYVDVRNVYKFINVSYIRSASFSAKENGIQVRKKVCLGLPTEFSLLYTRVDSVKWDFGDPASGASNYSTALAPSHNYNAVGTYAVKAILYKSCNIDSAVTQVSIDPDPIVHLPSFLKDTVVCMGVKLFIDAATPAATTYQWSDGLIYSYREIDKPGNFTVQAYNACSSDQKSFTVSFKECPCEVFTPSAFTPNHDGLNDDFKPVTECTFAKNYLFQIFNRYGNIVFSTSELNKGWNGDYNYMPAPTGVYVWMLKYANPATKQTLRKQGTVALIR
jgi:gliding motility-associated-like protein